MHFQWSACDHTYPVQVHLRHMHSAPPWKYKVSLNILRCCICQKISTAFCACPIFKYPNIMVVLLITFGDDILLKTLQTSSMFPHFAYMSTNLLPTKTSESHLLSTIHSWTHLPSSSASVLAHAFNAPTKVIKSGHRWTHIAFVEVVPVPSTCAHISYIPITWWSKSPHLKMASFWTVSEHPPCLHILHTCQSSYSLQAHLNSIHFQWSAHEQTCLHAVQLCWHMPSTPHKSNRVWLHTLLHLLK